MEIVFLLLMTAIGAAGGYFIGYDRGRDAGEKMMRKICDKYHVLKESGQ